MHDIRVQLSGDMCMTLSVHTSTLPHLVVQGRVFEAPCSSPVLAKKVPKPDPL